MTRYVYSAAGEKLRAVHETAVPNIVVPVGQTHELTADELLFKDSTDYLLGGALVLKNGRIDKYLFDGGYCQAKVAESHFWITPEEQEYWTLEQLDAIYEAQQNADDFSVFYYNRDHQGNVREVVDGDNGRVVQTINYYPFGMQYCDEGIDYSVQPYMYNGKEFDRVHGLNTYDYGARQYNPVTGRWHSMDPLCEKYYNVSPYVYCANNPVNATDPDGMRVVNSQGKYIYYINQSKQLSVSNFANENERMVYVGLMLTATGRRMLRQMINSKTSIDLVFDSRCASDTKRNVTYAETKQYRDGSDNGIYKGKDGKFRTRYATITFYLNTIEESLSDPTSENVGLTLTEALGAEAAHKSVHASDVDEVDKDISSVNGGSARCKSESERKPREVEQKYRDELDERSDRP